MAKILIIEDDSSLAKDMTLLLESKHHTVDCSGTLADGRFMIKTFEYDLIILDWNLPDGAGIELCRWLRSQEGAPPILMVTGMDKTVDKVTGLDCGADDYITKPFDPLELSARVRALVRRLSTANTNTLTSGVLCLDVTKREVLADGKAIVLQPREFALLELLMRYPGRVFSGDELLNRIWPTEADVTNIALRACITRLRHKLTEVLGDSPIKTVHRAGYKFESP